MHPLRHFRAWVARHRRDREMRAEMEAHLELQAGRNRAAGMEAGEARFAAEREFGNVTSIQQRVREQRPGAGLAQLGNDVRHACRSWLRSPLLAAVVIVSLGIGLGVNAVVFSWMRGLIFRPIPGVDPAANFRLVEPQADNGSFPGASWREYQDLQPRLRAFSDLTAYRMAPLNFGEPGNEERVHAQLVAGSYFTTLGVKAWRGRMLDQADTLRPGGERVGVVSHHFWRDRLGGDPAVVGREVKVNGQVITIIGIAPAEFEGTVLGLTFDFWLPATLAPVFYAGNTELEARDNRGYSLLGRLAPGATEAQAQAEVRAAMQDLAHAHPESNRGYSGAVLPFWRAPRGAAQFLLPGLGALQGFMLLLLLMVCANAANLLQARVAARRREIGVRLALGARPAQVLRMFLVESLVLAALAAVLGALVANWGANALRAVPLPGGFPFSFHTELGAPGYAALAGLTLVSVLLFGLWPAWESASVDSQLALRAARQPGDRRQSRRWLLAAESALALLVLIVAALFMRNFLETRIEDPGFRIRGVLLAGYDLSGAGYDERSGPPALAELLQDLERTPGVAGVAVASWVPLDFHGMPHAAFSLAGRPRADGGLDRALTYAVTPGYFALMGLQFTTGHDFVPLAQANQPAQIVVNEEFVRRYLGDTPPLGQRIGGRTASYEVVGVVRNALYENFGERPKPIIYFSYRDRFLPYGQIHVLARDSEAALAPDLQGLLQKLNPRIAVYDVRTLSEHVDKNLFFRRIPARLFAGLGPLVLLLAAIGVYAAVAFTTTQRTAEIGVRLALGASRHRVVREIVVESVRHVAWGAVPAWLIAVVVMLHLRGGVLNLTILVGVPAILAAVTMLAAWLPARRAARVDPVVALRAE